MRRIDHLVLAVRDVEAASAFYGKLGFLVGARNRHPWGTENRLVQFRSSFLELITTGDDAEAIPPHGPRRFSFGAFVRDFLRARKGLAMVVLDSADAASDAAAFACAGLGDFKPFFFERKGRRPDGSETHVAFTLAFAVDPHAPGLGFFVCQQHFPENFWNTDLQRHPNGATGVSAVCMTAPDPETHEPFLKAFTGVAAEPAKARGRSFPLANGRIDLSGADPKQREIPARFASFTVSVASLHEQAERLRRASVPFDARSDGLVVPAHAANGVEIIFSEG